MRTASRYPGLTPLMIAFIVLAYLSFVAGAAMVVVGHGTGWAALGSGLLSLAAAFAVGGAGTAALRLFEHKQGTLAAWVGILAEVVRIDHDVEFARQLLLAHKTADAYSRQYTVLVDAQLALRRLRLDPLVVGDKQLSDARMTIGEHLEKGQLYLNDLTREYELEYKAVARLQRVDDLRLDEWCKTRLRAVPDARPPRLGEEIHALEPTEAWMRLETLPKLTSFLSKHEFEDSALFSGVSMIKPILETRAGIEPRPPGSYERTAIDPGVPV